MLPMRPSLPLPAWLPHLGGRLGVVLARPVASSCPPRAPSMLSRRYHRRGMRSDFLVAVVLANVHVVRRRHRHPATAQSSLSLCVGSLPRDPRCCTRLPRVVSSFDSPTQVAELCKKQATTYFRASSTYAAPTRILLGWVQLRAHVSSPSSPKTPRAKMLLSLRDIQQLIMLLPLAMQP